MWRGRVISKVLCKDTGCSWFHFYLLFSECVPCSRLSIFHSCLFQRVRLLQRRVPKSSNYPEHPPAPPLPPTNLANKNSATASPPTTAKKYPYNIQISSYPSPPSFGSLTTTKVIVINITAYPTVAVIAVNRALPTSLKNENSCAPSSLLQPQYRASRCVRNKTMHRKSMASRNTTTTAATNSPLFLGSREVSRIGVPAYPDWKVIAIPPPELLSPLSEEAAAAEWWLQACGEWCIVVVVVVWQWWSWWWIENWAGRLAHWGREGLGL